MKPNLDATGHWWVGALVQFNFELKYQKGHDNTVVDVLSWVTPQLDPDTVRSILHRVALGTVHWVEVHGPTIVESNHCIEQEVCVTTGPCTSANACNGLGWSPKRGPSTECSFRPDVGKEDRFEGTSGIPCLQWGRQTDPMKSIEFYNLFGEPYTALDAQGQDWRSATIYSP